MYIGKFSKDDVLTSCLSNLVNCNWTDHSSNIHLKLLVNASTGKKYLGLQNPSALLQKLSFLYNLILNSTEASTRWFYEIKSEHEQDILINNIFFVLYHQN